MARARRYREVLAAQVKDIQDGRAPACTKRGLARSSPARPAVGSRLASGRDGRPLVGVVGLWLRRESPRRAAAEERPPLYSRAALVPDPSRLRLPLDHQVRATRART